MDPMLRRPVTPIAPKPQVRRLPLAPRPFSIPPPAKKRLWPKIVLPMVPVLLAAGIVAVVTLHHPKKIALISMTLPMKQVHITAASFSPATITVKKGQSVTWTNQDAQPHQIVSDLPGFDEATPLPTGDSFTFNFATPGTYTYHDQLNPATTVGTVIVK